MEDFMQNYFKSEDFKKAKDIYALYDFLQVKDEDIINKGCLIEDLHLFANGYITFLDKNGEKKILTDEDVANFEPEIIDGKRLYRIDFVRTNQKKLAQNEHDFKEIWEYWLNKKKINSLIASVGPLKELLISETQQFQKLHKDNTDAEQRDMNLINLSNDFIAFLTATDKPATSKEEKKGFDLSLDKPQLESLHKALIDEKLLVKCELKHFINAFNGQVLAEGFEPLKWLKSYYASIFVCHYIGHKTPWQIAERVFNNGTSNSLKNAYKPDNILLSDNQKNAKVLLDKIFKNLP